MVTLMPRCSSRTLDLVLHLPPEVDFRDANVALRVAVHVLQFRDFARAEALDERFGKEGHAIRTCPSLAA